MRHGLILTSPRSRPVSRLELDAGGEITKVGVVGADVQVIGHARDQPFDPEPPVVAEGPVEVGRVVARAEPAFGIPHADPDAAPGLAVVIEQAARDGPGRLESDG